MDKRELIALLIKVEEGNRHLDLAVFNAIGPVDPPWRFLDDSHEVIGRDQYGPDAPGNPVFGLEHFTTSIDDAASLVLDGERWYVERTDWQPNCYAALGYGPAVTKASTCALALCAAVLEASVADAA